MPEGEKVKGSDLKADQGVSLNEITLEDIARRCMDSPGYVIFAAKIANKPDAKGNLVIDYLYRRVNFSFEDTREAVKKFRAEYIADVSGGLQDA